MRNNELRKKIFAFAGVMVMLSVCLAGLTADDSDASATTINLVPGQTYQYTPTFSSGLSPTVTVSSSSSSQPTSSSTYSATSGYASVSSGTVSVTVPSSYSGSYYYVTIKATTTNPTQTAYQEIAFRITSDLTITGPSSAVGAVGRSFSYTPSTNATSAGWTITSFSVSPSLPSGRSFNSATGTITGTPSAVSSAQTYTITVKTTAPTVTKTLAVSIAIEPGLAATVPTDVYAAEGGAYDPASITVSSGVSGVTFAVTDAGSLALSKISVSSDGKISVAAASGDAGDYTVTVTIGSDNQGTVVKTFALHISAQLNYTSSPTSGFYVVG